MTARTRRSPGGDRGSAGQTAGWDTDTVSVAESFPQVLATGPALRIAAGAARLEHLHLWLAFEEENIFPTAIKVALIEAISPFMGPTTVLADGIAGWLAARAEGPSR